MKPRLILESSFSSDQIPLTLVSHDDRFFLESNGRQIDASALSHPAHALLSILTRPFRPARQPRLIFLGLGFAHALSAALELLPQLKASFVVLPESPDLPAWLTHHLPQLPLADPRIHIHSNSPFAHLPADLNESQGLIADLDSLEAIAPPRWNPESSQTLANWTETLKNGGLLGLLTHRPRPQLEKSLRKLGYDLAIETTPLSPNSKKNRTLYLARKGDYHHRR